MQVGAGAITGWCVVYRSCCWRGVFRGDGHVAESLGSIDPPAGQLVHRDQELPVLPRGTEVLGCCPRRRAGGGTRADRIHWERVQSKGVESGGQSVGLSTLACVDQLKEIKCIYFSKHAELRADLYQINGPSGTQLLISASQIQYAVDLLGILRGWR